MSTTVALELVSEIEYMGCSCRKGFSSGFGHELNNEVVWVTSPYRVFRRYDPSHQCILLPPRLSEDSEPEERHVLKYRTAPIYFQKPHSRHGSSRNRWHRCQNGHELLQTDWRKETTKASQMQGAADADRRPYACHNSRYHWNKDKKQY